jgi:hypothetical protein
MQSLRMFFRTASYSLMVALLTASMCTAAKLSGQAITVTPPSYPLTTLPYPDLFPNAASHWGRMAPQNTAGGFLPTVPLTRVVGSVHWPNIQPESSQTYWSSSLNGLGMNQSTGSGGSNCSSTSIASYWWPEASCFGSDGSYTSNPSNILYTFLNVPQWASVSYGTFQDANGSTVGWKVTNVSNQTGTCTAKGTSCTLTLTISFSGGSGLASGTPVLVNITNNGGSSYSSYKVTPTYGAFGSNSQTLTVTLSDVVATPTTTNSYVSFTLAQPPSDVYSSKTCTLPDGNTSTNGDCYFKSFVTWMMMNSCRGTNGQFGVTVKTGSPALSTCVIHYWEGWNEFNSDGFWTGNYSMLAKMMSDAETIIKQYCNNCYFVAGSVTAGGDAGHYTSGLNINDSSGVYIQALGQLVKDWYYYNKNYGNTVTPDALSVHPYPGYDNIYMPAMPETREPVKFDPKLSGYTGINTCTGTYTDSSGTVWGTPYGCVNICGRTYQSNGSYTVNNPLPGLGCTEYAANPESSTYGNAWPGCGDFQIDGTTPNLNSLTVYAKDSGWTADPPKQACRDSFVNALRSANDLLSTMIAVGDLPSSFVGSSLPIWNTESSWGSFGETNFVGANTNSPFHDPDDASLTTFIQQAYIARYGILAAESNAALNLWYQWDEASTTTYPGAPVTYPAQFQVSGEPDEIESFSNWGQLGNNFVTGSESTNGTMQATRAAYTFNRVYHWLSGMQGVTNVVFNGTPPSGRWTGNQYYAQNTTIYDGVNVQRVVTAGTSGSSAPAWNGALYGQTTDGSVVWENMGDKNCYDTSTFNSNPYPNNVTPSVFMCQITGSGGYKGTILWYTPFDQYTTYPAPTGQTCLKDIDGNLKEVTAGSYHTILNRPAIYDNTPSSECTGTDGLPE